MKYLLSFAALFLFIQAHSQANHTTPILDVATYGYVGGQRLDSIDAVFAVLDLNMNNRIYFDFGQNRSDRKEFMVTDVKGKVLSFPVRSTAFILNFLHYNHWDFIGADTARYVVRKQ